MRLEWAATQRTFRGCCLGSVFPPNYKEAIFKLGGCGWLLLCRVWAKKSIQLSWKTNVESGRVGPAEIRACRLNRPLWGMQLLYQLPWEGTAEAFVLLHLSQDLWLFQTPNPFLSALSHMRLRKTLIVGGTLKNCFWQRLLFLQGQAE